jgi:hypothetical protein
MASSEERKKEEQPPNFNIKHVDVRDEGKGTDSVSLAASVLTGYTLLSGTFNVNQANLAKKFNLDKNIQQLVINNYQIVNGNVCGDVIQANNSEVNFSQQVTDAFKTAYNTVEKKEDISPNQKEEIVEKLKLVEMRLQSKQDLDEIPSSKPMKWLKQNASWIVPAIIQVVTLGVKIALGTGIA